MNEQEQLAHLMECLTQASDALTHALDFTDARNLNLDGKQELEDALTLIDRTRQMLDCEIRDLDRPEWAAVNDVQFVAIGDMDRRDQAMMECLEPENLEAGHFAVWFNDCDNLDFQGDVLPFDEAFVPGW